jgi:putative Mg2+ transporter-C (MgtC) family protein
LDWLDPAWITTLRLSLLGRLVLATVLGGLVGLERELAGKPAGLRTNILICIGATLLMDVSLRVAGAATVGPADPGRIAAQVVSGIGFLGAGTILVERGSVVGLTTAATIWVVAAIGLAVGSHNYVAATGTTLLVVLTLFILGRIEGFLFERRTESRMDLVLEPREAIIEEVVGLLKKHGIKVRHEKVVKQQERYQVSFELKGSSKKRMAAFNEVVAAEGVRKVTVHS